MSAPASLSVAPTATRLIETQGMTLRVATTEGEAGQPPLVMFNGIGANLELLDDFVAALDPSIPTIRFDVPGIGGSPRRWLPYRFSGLARSVAEVCDRLGHTGQLDVFGISWGGAAAQAFLWQQRKRCRRAILAATSMGMAMVPASPSVWLRMASPARYWSKGYLERAAPAIYGGDLRQHPEMIGQLAAKIRGTTLLGYLQQLFAGLGWTSLPWIWRIKQPVLIMAGLDDPLIRISNPKMMARLIPNSQLITYDCGHLFLFTRQQKAAADVGEFLLPR